MSEQLLGPIFGNYFWISEVFVPSPEALGLVGPWAPLLCWAQAGPRLGPGGAQEGSRKDAKIDLKKFRSTFRPEFKNVHF